jgi:protein-tyrosine-phosphatase
MAEGWARHLKSKQIEAFSAGIEPKGANLLAIRVMKEAGVDISGQRPKHVMELLDQPFDYVVTLCGGAQGSLPCLPERHQGSPRRLRGHRCRNRKQRTGSLRFPKSAGPNSQFR